MYIPCLINEMCAISRLQSKFWSYFIIDSIAKMENNL